MIDQSHLQLVTKKFIVFVTPLEGKHQMIIVHAGYKILDQIMD